MYACMHACITVHKCTSGPQPCFFLGCLNRDHICTRDCAFTCVCVCVCVLYVTASVMECMPDAYLAADQYTRHSTNLCVCVCVCVHVSLYVFVRAYVHVHVHVWECACGCGCDHAPVCSINVRSPKFVYVISHPGLCGRNCTKVRCGPPHDLVHELHVVCMSATRETRTDTDRHGQIRTDTCMTRDKPSFLLVSDVQSIHVCR